jgi:hypothetical protein
MRWLSPVSRVVPREARERALMVAFCVVVGLASCARAQELAAVVDGSGGQGGGSGTGTTGAVPLDDAGACGSTCSSDRQRVVDCGGQTVATCAPGASGAVVDEEPVCLTPCEKAVADKSSVGCDYYLIAPDGIELGWGACLAAFVANTSDQPITMTLERDGKSLDLSEAARIPSGSGPSLTLGPVPNGEVPPGEVAIVFIAEFNSAHLCPAGIQPAFELADAAVHGTGLGHAFHLVTSAPVVAYDIVPYGGSSSALTSATLLLPTSVWDTNYVAVNAYRRSEILDSTPNTGLTVWPTLAVVAAEDDTEVTISPTADIFGGPGVLPTPAGVPRTYTLARGQVLHFAETGELTGSPIESDKPIGVWGGAQCMNIDVDETACDVAHQQLPPVKALGHEYVAVRYRNRYQGVEEAPPWRIVGAVDGTELTYEPAPPRDAPAVLQGGEVAEFRAPGPFVVRSQGADHPFYMSAHMTSCGEVTDLVDCRGDPEFVNVIPAAQYLDSYVFFTDPTYPETNLVVVRTKGASGFQDVTLDCAGPLGDWQPVDSSGVYEYTRIDLVRGNFEKQGACDNGRHEMSSAAPFGVTVWGWGSGATAPPSDYVSYAYPAGARIHSINDVIVPAVPK